MNMFPIKKIDTKSASIKSISYLENEYDAIVIGAGLGALNCACSLALNNNSIQ